MGNFDEPNWGISVSAVTDRAGVTYIDLWPALSDGQGQLHAEYTLDRLHPGGRGYQVWVDQLRPFVERFQIGQTRQDEAVSGS